MINDKLTGNNIESGERHVPYDWARGYKHIIARGFIGNKDNGVPWSFRELESELAKAGCRYGDNRVDINMIRSYIQKEYGQDIYELWLERLKKAERPSRRIWERARRFPTKHKKLFGGMALGMLGALAYDTVFGERYALRGAWGVTKYAVSAIFNGNDEDVMAASVVGGAGGKKIEESKPFSIMREEPKALEIGNLIDFFSADDKEDKAKPFSRMREEPKSIEIGPAIEFLFGNSESEK